MGKNRPAFRKGLLNSFFSFINYLHFEVDASRLLAYHVGNHLQQLTKEIEKLSTYRDDDSAITDEDVRRVVGHTREFTMFDFSDLREKHLKKPPNRLPTSKKYCDC